MQHPEIYGGELDDDEEEEADRQESVESPIESPEETRSPAEEFQVDGTPAIDASEATPVEEAVVEKAEETIKSE